MTVLLWYRRASEPLSAGSRGIEAGRLKIDRGLRSLALLIVDNLSIGVFIELFCGVKWHLMDRKMSIRMAGKVSEICCF